ncbi:UNKNOWN [Stylonychia lemnae]|uniref:Uncharacterized protein n=1 Tax=Stylonychia lemnae TaxID=5949 RepID=A0A078B061_STYLE|nr:UNKNOWN [Stylonychia lemnae]|eukprot:CDW87874.1 UNKNOWN [Stylonychia lemnae]
MSSFGDFNTPPDGPNPTNQQETNQHLSNSNEYSFNHYLISHACIDYCAKSRYEYIQDQKQYAESFINRHNCPQQFINY